MGGAECVILECIAAAAQRGSGAETSVVALSAGPFLTAAESLGATTRVVVPPAAFGSIGDSFSSVGTVVRALLPALRRFPNFVGRFSAAVKGLLPQIIHSHGIKTHVLAALLFRRVPVVWHIHDYLGTRPVSSWLLRLLARRCALAIAVSDSVAQDARRLFAGRLPIVVVHNCVDCERFRPDGPALDLDALSGLPPAPAGTIRIGLPATFARWKGQDVFIKALARLEHPVRAYVIGGALYETERSQWSEGELRQLVSELGLDTQVGFTGFIDDMPSAYRALDVVVHASTRPEPFGLVIVEAMACGRALVAAPTGGAAALFVDRVQALAAESGNARALAAALDALAGDSALRAALGARARTHALASFGRDRFASSLGAALARVASI
jgi:glycosyltransferase involved in cell wall biosynthesis